MAQKRFVSSREAERRLGAFGPEEQVTEVLFRMKSPRGVLATDLEIVERAARRMGLYNVGIFLTSPFTTTAVRQLDKKRLEGVVQGNTQFDRKLAALDGFSRNLGTLLKSQRYKRYGYSFSLSNAFDAPFRLAIALNDVRKRGLEEIARFNFDLYFNKKGKPCVVLGNMQGGSKKGIERFRSATGEAPLDFFISSFKRAFPALRRLVALNARHHQYRKNLDRIVLANSMAHRGKMTEQERRDFNDYLVHLKDASPEILAVAQRVEEEAKRIAKEATGMHKAAYKKAGFRPTKSRYWRL